MKKLLIFCIVATVCIAAFSVWHAVGQPLQDSDRYAYLHESQSTRLDGIDIESAFYDGDHYVYGIHYPSTGNAAINRDIKGLVYRYLDSFVQEAEKYYDGPEPPGGFSANWKYELNIDYDIARPAPDIVSILFSIVEYTGGAHPNHKILAKTYNLDTGQAYSLDDVFIKDSGYLDQVSEMAYAQLKGNRDLREYLDDEWLKEGTAPKPEHYRHFILEEDNIAFYFDYYQVGPYVVGQPCVRVPYTALGGLLQVDTPGYPQSTEVPLTPLPAPSPEPDPGDGPMVALTFDDGPHDEYTPQILDVLKAHDAVATFFVVGNRAQYYPELIHRMAAEGNEIGIHTWDHKDLTKLGAEEIRKEVQDTADLVYGITGIWPQSMRPPYATINDAVKQNVGLPIVMWSVDPQDWATQDTDAIIDHVLENTREGHIILMHDMYAHSAAALEDIVTGLQEKGYRFVTVSQLLNLSEDNLQTVSGTVYRKQPSE